MPLSILMNGHSPCGFLYPLMGRTARRQPRSGNVIIENALGKAQVEVKEKRKRAIEESVGTDYGTFKTLHSGECSASGIYFSDCVQER